MNLARRLAFNGISNLISQIAASVGAIVLAVYLGPAGFGAFSAPIAAAGLAGFIYNWGLDIWLLREMPLSARRRETAGIAFAAKAALWLAALGPLLGILNLVNPELYGLGLLAGSLVDSGFEAQFRTGYYGLIGQGRSRAAGGLVIVLRAGRLAAVVAMIGLGVRSPTVFIVGRLAVAGVVALTSWILVRPIWPAASLRRGLRFMRRTLAFSASEALAAIYTRADITLVALLVRDAASIGQYSSASGMLSLAVTAPSTAISEVVPMLARRHAAAQGDFASAVRRFIGISTLVGTAGAVALALTATTIARFVLGPQYEPAGALVVVLAPIFAFKGLSLASSNSLLAMQRQAARLPGQLAAACTNVGLNLVLLGTYGVIGAAWAYCASEAVLAIVTTIACMRALRTWQPADGASNA